MNLTGDQASLLLDIASAQELPHVPVRYARDRDADARELERLGLVERHYIGKHYGAFATASGLGLLDLLKQALNQSK